MRHRVVLRIVVSLVATWVVAVLVFVRATTRSAPVSPEVGPTPVAVGAELFVQHCARCHDPSRLGLAWRSAEDRAAAAEAFATFLLKHHGPSPEGNAAIVHYLFDRDR